MFLNTVFNFFLNTGFLQGNFLYLKKIKYGIYFFLYILGANRKLAARLTPVLGLDDKNLN